MATKTGTAAANVLNSTAASDRLLGLGGNDTLNGNGGNDTLEGGPGNDRLVGGTGNDVYVYAAGGGTDTIVEAAGAAGGIDTLRSAVTVNALATNVENLVLTGAGNLNGTGNTGHNKITGTTGANKLSGLTGNDTLDGGSGNDSLSGGDGNDRLKGGIGTDTMVGGKGNDTYEVNAATDKVTETAVAGSGTDTIISTVTYSLNVAGRTAVENLTLGAGTINGTGNALANTLTGGTGNNILAGLGGNDKLLGGAGNDKLDGGTGNDTLTGGTGNDLFVVDAAGDLVVEALTGGNDTVQASVSETLDANVEHLVLTGADSIDGTGNTGANSITGNAGFNTLSGLAGNDVLSGAGGNDSLNGGDDNDSLSGGADNDILLGGAGNDTLDGGTGNDAMVGEAGNDILSGGAGADDLEGGENDDALSGGADNDQLDGAAGNDTLDGGTGSDTMTGGLGDDVFVVDVAGVEGDQVSDDDGIDTILSTVTYQLGEDFEHLTLLGADNINGTGNVDGANALTGNDGANMLSGLDGNDTLRGGAGTDTLDGGAHDDVLVWDAEDTLQGGEGTDTLRVETDGLVDLSLEETLMGGMEVIDLAGNTTLKLDRFKFDDYFSEETVTVNGGAGDVVMAGGGWTRQDDEGDYAVYTYDGVTLKVDLDIERGGIGVADLGLFGLGGTAGFQLNGFESQAEAGFSIAAGGDVNGDGYDDFVVGAHGGNAYAGEVYVVYGGTDGFPASLELSALDGTNGFAITSGNVGDRVGTVVSARGDVNGDGMADIVIGSPNETGGDDAGVYVVFGSSAFGSVFALSTLNGTNGFTLSGGGVEAEAGSAVSMADVNGDGYDDLLIGAPEVSGIDYTIGAAYVVLGGESLASAIDLGALDGTNGFGVVGDDGEDDLELGSSISAAGDVNGDGFEDFIIGEPEYGETYVVFGSPDILQRLVAGGDIVSLQEAGDAFKIDVEGYIGRAVAAAGDVDGDGLDDLIIGDTNQYGSAYVVFGNAAWGVDGYDTLSVDTLNGDTGFEIHTTGDEGDMGYAVSGAGDLNGDGYADLVVGDNLGRVYVVFGASSFSAEFNVLGIDGLNGLVLGDSEGITGLGEAVSGGRDINGDGFDDLILGAPDFNLGGGAEGIALVFFGGNFGAHVTHLGTAAAETLTGTGGDDLIVAGAGNDTLLGGGGNDLFRAGAGDDRIVIGAGDPRIVNGGAGDDTVAMDGFSASILLDGIETSGVTGIERADLSGTHANTVVVTKTGVLSLSDTTNILTVEGDAGDAVTLIGDWEEGDTVGDFTDWTSGAATVRIEEDLSVFTDSLSLGALDGDNGLAIAGIAIGDRAGISVAAAGDVDGDGLGDIIIGAHTADVGFFLNAGNTYVVFGDALAGESALDLGALTGASGFRFNGFEQSDVNGYSVASAGDVNGDGYADVIMGAYGANPAAGNNAGQAYVVFGSSTLEPPLFPGALNGTNGFSLDGVVAGDIAGGWVSSAGDVNGDGYDDILVGANAADFNGINTGSTYLVYGMAGGFADPTLLSSPGIARFDGIGAGNFSGRTVAEAGDFNGDGYDDFVLGVGDSPNECYVVFGSGTPLPAETELSALDGTNGFRIDGPPATQFGRNAASAGDFNGDGYSDLIIGANTADTSAGRSYVIFGEAGPQDAVLSFEALDGTNGFIIKGVAAGDDSGISIASAGDFNGDGYDDVIIGAHNAGPGDTGVSYIVYGAAEGLGSSSFDLSALDGLNGFTLTGIAAGDHSGRSVASAGDVNGDGYDDVIIGAMDFGNADTGASYVIYGGNRNGAVEFDGGEGNDVLTGTTNDDNFEAFVGGLGNDTLTGGLGDAFSGGAGDDVISIAANEFRRVDGGAGFDTLLFGAADFDLSFSGSGSTRVMGIEALDMRGNGDADFELSLQDLLDLSDTSNMLTIDGDAGDEVYMLTTTGWTEQADQGSYNVWTQGAATLKVHVDVAVYFET